MTAQPVVLPHWECLELLRAHTIGRLCVVDAGVPLAFPVNYAIVGDNEHPRFMMRTSPTTIIGAYEGPASIEIDHIDLDAGDAWSVIVRGTIRHLIGQAGALDPQPLVSSNRTMWSLLEPNVISGRRFVIGLADDGYSVEWQLATG